MKHSAAFSAELARTSERLTSELDRAAVVLARRQGRHDDPRRDAHRNGDASDRRRRWRRRRAPAEQGQHEVLIMLEERPGSATEFAALRQLLVGPEQQQLDELADRVEEVAVTPQSLADQLPEAIALSTSRDRQLGRALAPTVETALRESIRRNPREIATAIFPVLGPAIRKAIAETMAGLVRSINSAVEHSFSVQGIKWRIEAWRTGVRYPEVVIKHALVYRVEQVFLIHAETGLLLAHVTAADLNVPDADLISGMLTAIQDFVRDSFRPGEGGTLSAFTVGEHTVHVEAGPRALIAGVIRGQCPGRRSATSRAHARADPSRVRGASSSDFEGDAAPFATATPLLEENLETVLSTDHAGDRGKMRVAALGTSARGVVALVVAGLATASWMRWRRAVRLMEAEPGFVVVDASRSWRQWDFRGLKDPLARDPRAVFTAAASTPRTIVGAVEAVSLTRLCDRRRTRPPNARRSGDGDDGARRRHAARRRKRIDRLARQVARRAADRRRRAFRLVVVCEPRCPRRSRR